jgi:hypothetical protein
VRDRPALKSYTIFLLLCWWAFAAPFSWYLAATIGWFALYIWLAANLLLAYWLNQSRTHSQTSNLDDRLPPERVAKAQAEYVKEALEARSKRGNDDD